MGVDLKAARKISFYGHFGTLNTGNESTLLATLLRLRALFPVAEFSCICSNPEAVAASYGIKAVPISDRAARIWDRRTPLSARVIQFPVALGKEVGEYVRAFRALRETDTFIVPGTGLLTDAYGLSGWGPYSLFKWTLVARLRRCRVVLLSVGAGPIYSSRGRLLVRSVLAIANYRSYRDTSSLEYVESIGFGVDGDRIYPDLAFSLPPTVTPTSHDKPAKRRVVGLGLMVYDGKLDAARPAGEIYEAYLDALSVFVDWLLANNYDVRLLLGDGDTPVIEDFRAALRARAGTYDEERVIEEPVDSVSQILAQLAASDFVVATRFHNVLLALLLGRPVIAISFHHKSSSLMSHMGLSEYCQDIRRLDSRRLIEQFQTLERNRVPVEHAIGEKVEESRRALEEQYDLLFAHG